MGSSIVLLSDAAMRASQQVKAAGNSSTPALGSRLAVRRSVRLLRDERQAKTARVAIILSLFIAFLGVALLVGGRAFIDPLLETAAQARKANQVGAVVFTMPDGAFCRHLSFNNATAEVTESAVSRCPEARPRANARERVGVKKGFAWGSD
jgi:hypothetical protein